MQDLKKKFAFELLDIGAIRFGAFKIKLHETHPDAPLSPIYIDLRLCRRFPEVKATAVKLYASMLKHLKFDLIADVPTAGTPFASSLSDLLKVGMVTPRMNKKSYGSGNSVDGLLEEDIHKTVVLIDDLITTAQSKFEAAQLLADQGLRVHDVVVLFDREQGGRDALKKKGFELHTVYTLNELLSIYVEHHRLSQERYVDILQKLAELTQAVA
jgi:uridine monophosphate synthetase